MTLNMKEFNENFEGSLKGKLIQVKGDGHCFFYSIFYEISLNNNNTFWKSILSGLEGIQASKNLLKQALDLK